MHFLFYLAIKFGNHCVLNSNLWIFNCSIVCVFSKIPVCFFQKQTRLEQFVLLSRHFHFCLIESKSAQQFVSISRLLHFKIFKNLCNSQSKCLFYQYYDSQLSVSIIFLALKRKLTLNSENGRIKWKTTNQNKTFLKFFTISNI